MRAAINAGDRKTLTTLLIAAALLNLDPADWPSALQPILDRCRLRVRRLRSPVCRRAIH
jgi:hypothetical protein